MVTELKFKSFAEMLQKLPDDKTCRDYLEHIIWEGDPFCPHCGMAEPYRLTEKGEYKGLWKCARCKRRFNVMTKTVFEGSHIPLRKWFIAIYIMQSHKKGISSYQLARDLGITQASSWYMLHRIRSIMKDKNPDQLNGIVQLDETFVGGKNKNRHADKKVEQSQGRSFKDKTPVFGILEQGSSKKVTRPNKINPLKNVIEKVYLKFPFVRCKVVPDTSSKSIKPIINKNIQKGSIVVSDEWNAYNGLSRKYNHFVVDHGRGQYVSPEGFTTNALEGFWTWIKKTYNATYHKMSRKHLQSYVDECAFRYNFCRAKEQDRFNSVLSNIYGRLFYNQLIGIS